MEVLVSVSAEVSSPLVMTGESLVPVMVMATVVVSESEELTPLSSWRVECVGEGESFAFLKESQRGSHRRSLR